ncbi:transposase [Candidatus Enterovibrio escicola]|uniref:transposase n=1 Tax=Candidatus Enterovibrio escicola TaxID=1927127 RepID=UPI001238055C|nr:transposase [Candidatus Enterovibrio escacola]
MRYLTNYLSSPSIGLSRIVGSDGHQIRYYYQSHKTKLKTYETVDIQVFVGRLAQHSLPKGFQRVRYFGLQATTSFKKWYEVIARAGGDLVDAMMSYTKRISYVECFEEIAGRNHLKCVFCG